MKIIEIVKETVRISENLDQKDMEKDIDFIEMKGYQDIIHYKDGSTEIIYTYID